MISARWKLVVVVTLFLTLFLTLGACAPKESDSDSMPVAEQAPASQDEAPNPITSRAWCRGDDWESFQTILRVRLTKTEIHYEYLKADKTAPFSIYPFKEKPVWIEKTNSISTPDLGTYMVSYVQSETAIPLISGFEKQKKLVEEILINHPQAKAPQVPFAPQVALQIRSRSYENGEVVERNLYPCELYSETFLGEGPARPLTELNLQMGELQGNYTPENNSDLAQQMAMAYPVEEAAVDLAQLSKTQWCSWRQVSATQLTLQTLTFGKDQFFANKHTEVFALLDSEEERAQSLTDNAERTEAYEMTLAGAMIRGRNLTEKLHPNHRAHEIFSFVRDSAGALVMIRRDRHLPEWGRPVFEDRYYDCSRSEPTRFSAVFGTYLKAILDLQLQRAQ
jgi:hypothetical protein